MERVIGLLFILLIFIAGYLVGNIKEDDKNKLGD